MKITDEQIVNAVISHRTNAEAARSLKMSESQLYQRMQSKNYRDLLNQMVMAETEHISGILREKIETAVDSIVELATNEEVPAAVRLSAANSLIGHYVKMVGFCRGARNHVSSDKEDDLWRNLMTP